ncbi:MAG: AAA family ATPase [Candidatus Dormibacteria bacterium]
MRIANVKVNGYRCLKQLDVDLAGYTVLVGPNGSGKSSFLYALNWFFNGGLIAPEDLHCLHPDAAVPELSVEVTFDALTAQDHLTLERYGHGTTARFRRSWSKETGKEKIVGNSSQGPGFAEVRAASARVTEMRTLYAQLRRQHPELEAATAREDIMAQLARWEGNPANEALLTPVSDDDATHMFGIAGEHVLSTRIQMVLVPASADMAGELGSSGRGSALSRLIGNLMKDAVATARGDWEAKFATQIQELDEAIEETVLRATEAQAALVNAHLKGLVPAARVEFVADAPSWNLRDDASLRTDVVIDGIRNDVSRQGHGIQRAIMIAMLQSLVRDQTYALQQAEPDIQGAKATDQRPQASDDSPSLLICIEEPEIYQHPVRARSFGRILSVLGGRTDTQVCIATHSPYFVLPEQFDSLRCFSLSSGWSAITRSSAAAVGEAAGISATRVTKVVEKELPRSFSEAFFADAVVFVEGDTDRVVLEGIADLLGVPLDRDGIAVLAMGGKSNLRVPFEILDLLKIAVYLVTDGDTNSGSRKHATDVVKQQEAEASHRDAVQTLVSWLPPANVLAGGTIPFVFRQPTLITSRYTIFGDDLESELEKWPSWLACLKAVGGELRAKNVASYRAATAGSQSNDIPPSLSGVVWALRSIRGTSEGSAG